MKVVFAKFTMSIFPSRISLNLYEHERYTVTTLFTSEIKNTRSFFANDFSLCFKTIVYLEFHLTDFVWHIALYFY